MRIRGMDNTVLQHFNKKGKAKRTYQSKELAKTNLSLGDTVYQCGLCNLWHRSSSRK